MNSDLRRVGALTAAGLLWGTTVPLSKVALEWLPPGWLTFVRFAVAAAILLVAVRSRLRAAWSPAVLAWGAVGYGGSVLVQNAGITRTSVSHAALLIGATPVLVAVVAALWRGNVARPVAWAGFAVSLAGVGLVAGGTGGGATTSGDALVLVALLISATFTVAQTGLLRGRDPVAVTAIQFLGAALAALPVAVLTEHVPAAPSGSGTLLACAGLALGGTLAPFTLFAYGQGRVSAEVAGAFLNLEPLVGAVAGIVLFGDPAGLHQVLGGAAILAGIALGSLPLLAAGRRHTAVGPAMSAIPAEHAGLSPARREDAPRACLTAIPAKHAGLSPARREDAPGTYLTVPADCAQRHRTSAGHGAVTGHGLATGHGAVAGRGPVTRCGRVARPVASITAEPSSWPRSDHRACLPSALSRGDRHSHGRKRSLRPGRGARRRPAARRPRRWPERFPGARTRPR